MNYKKLFGTLLLSAALALPASAYTVTTVEEKPQWQIDWSYNQERPDWQEPDAGAFENWTVMLVKIEETLHPYVSADDLLALFVGDEMRGLASPSVDVSTDEVDATQFLMKIYGNENLGDEMTLTMKYYNAQLRQLFTLSETMTLDEEVLVGFDKDFIPPFSLGSPKYPVTTTIDMLSIATGADITPAEGDIAAAFVGDECRGVWTVDNGSVQGDLQSVQGDLQSPNLTVYLRDADEEFVLKYYDASSKRMHLFEADDNNPIFDANGDGKVDVADISKIVSSMANNPNDRKADVNGDGVVDVADIVTVINYMASK